MADQRCRAHETTGPPLHEQEARLDPVLTSAAAARRLVRDALEAADRSEWADAGELAISELVTNAALHAHTEIDLRLEVFNDRLCVEVRDFNPALPVRRGYEDEATTGRGMGLVATVALDCGVHSLGDDGKITWFCVGTLPTTHPDDLLDEWDLDAWDTDTTGDGESEQPAPDQRRVELCSFPVTLWQAAHQHHDAVLRELVLYVAARPGVDLDKALAAADRARAWVAKAVDLVAEDGHHGVVDLHLSVPDDAGADFSSLRTVLDLAETLSEQGALFAPPAFPEINAVRDWLCGQVVDQLPGSPAVPWPGAHQERFETEAKGRRPLDATAYDTCGVDTADTPVIAADEANRIVAVSPPLADLLGWRIEDLVGRRVVTIIPPAHREAHVAGFSRHLSTGEAHILGVPLELPVLRIDGTEVMCRFLIERATDSPGGALYVARIDPID